MLHNALSTAAFYGVPFVVLSNARQVAQKRQRARLIQPAPTLPNDSRGLACGLGDGMACNPKQHGDGGFSSGH